MVERRSPKPDVEGSSPSGRDLKEKELIMIGAESNTPQWVENMTNSVKTYFRGVRTEWGKISWPEKRQVIAETVFVVAIVFVFTVAVYLMDIIFKGLLGLIK